jgi:hypothetical protein
VDVDVVPTVAEAGPGAGAATPLVGAVDALDWPSPSGLALGPGSLLTPVLG